MTPKKLLWRAGAIALLYVLLHLAGGRQNAGFLSATPVSSVLLGCAYVTVHFLFVIVAPILVIAAGILAIEGRLFRGRA